MRQRRSIVLLTVGLVLARVGYNVWLSPYELVADEAQYWDWSRHLEWSYYSKGPGIAWLIALVTHTLGDAEWAIRLPAALSFAVVTLALAWLTADGLGGSADAFRAAAAVPVIITLIPAYQLYALVMTIDPPALACWALALCAAWRVFQTEISPSPRGGPWVALGLALGVGFLFKYTDLLLVPGLLAFAWLSRSLVQWRRAWPRALLAAVLALGVMSPVLVWNAKHDAAGIRHVLGYVDAPGADHVEPRDRSVSARTVVEYPVVQFLVIGPVLVVALAGANVLRRQPHHINDMRFVRFLACAAVPMLLVFALASFRTRIEGNWPMAAFFSAVPLAAVAAARGVATHWWRATLAYGVISLIVIHAPLMAARLPVAGRLVPVHRFHGNRDRIQLLGDGVRRFLQTTEDKGVLIGLSHNEAGLLAYYLPGRPTVASAGPYLGARRSAYDFFQETDLAGPAITNRPALFIGGDVDAWRRVCRCPDLTMVDPQGPQFVTTAFVR